MEQGPASTTSATKTDKLGKLDADVSSRVVDLRIVVKRRKTGEKLFEVGGRWDRAEERFLDEPCKRGKILYLNEAQCFGEDVVARIEDGPALALKAWIEARRAGDPRVIELVFDGSRGSGKTHLSVLAVFIIAVAFPGARCWLVSPANTRRPELEKIVRDHIPREWRAWSARDLTVTLPNGSTITYLGAEDEDALKQGGFEVALLNEAQLMTKTAFVNAVGGVRNVGGRPTGLLILAHNYADKVRGEWTNDHLDAIEAGTLNAKHFKLDPTLNEIVEEGARDDAQRAASSVDKDKAELDYSGVRKRLGEFAAPAFKPYLLEQGGHIGNPPTRIVGLDGKVRAGWTDVTIEVTSKKTETQGYPIVFGADFQRRPGCVATAFKLWRREDGKIVYHAQWHVVAGDNEDDLSRRMDEYLATLGLTARDALVVADSTGRHQNASHSSLTKPSHAILREWHFHVVAPKRMKVSGGFGIGNPDVEDSLPQFYDVCTENRFIVTPEAPWLSESLRRCKTKKRGGTIRLDDSKPGYSHGVDTCRYVTWYFEPRRGPVAAPVDKKFNNELRSIRVFGGG